MGLLDIFKKNSKQEKEITSIGKSRSEEISNNFEQTTFVDGTYSSYNHIVTEVWDGEKTPGELGFVKDSIPDHLRLRLRAYDMNLKTDIIKIITGKFFKWVIGKGLKLQAEPSEDVLKMFGITEDITRFKKESESLFNLYANSKYSDYHKKTRLHAKAVEAFNTAFLGGDCLCIIRVDKFGPNIQVIDGQQVESPIDPKGKTEGNIIKHGIEINPDGKYVAFWVSAMKDESEIKHERIEAENELGQTVAWMIYGTKHRIDHHRGIPVVSSILEKVAKLDRFVEASVKKAEETANVVYAFKHMTNSTGENILTQSLTSKKTSEENPNDVYEKNGRTAASLRQSTSGTVMNLTPDSDLISLSSPSETSFNEFFRAVFTTLCAAVDIPEEVALQKYEQSYSSSRAAINGWEHIIDIYRDNHSFDFYQKFYRVWLDYQIFSENIKLKGFNKSYESENFMALEAYYASKITGKKMPHIDPLKEAKAVRSMIGNNDTALMSYEAAAELLGLGDWDSNYSKFIEEDKKVIKPEVNEPDNKPNKKQ